MTAAASSQSWYSISVTVAPDAAEAIEYAFNSLEALGTEINHLRKKNAESVTVVGYFNELPNEERVQDELHYALTVYGFTEETAMQVVRDKILRMGGAKVGEGKAEAVIWARTPKPVRGPQPAYTLDQIADAAIRIADTEGLEALTMRRLATEIGAGAMSLYRYVPSREMLLDGVVEAVVDELYGDPDVHMEASHGWQDYLHRLAHGVRRIALAHPAVFPLVATRPRRTGRGPKPAPTARASGARGGSGS